MPLPSSTASGHEPRICGSTVKPVDDPTTHPSTANACRSLAALYDLQTRPDLVDTMTFPSPTSGDRSA